MTDSATASALSSSETAALPAKALGRRRASIFLGYLEQLSKAPAVPLVLSEEKKKEEKKKEEKKEEKKALVFESADEKEMDRNQLVLSAYGSGLSDSDLASHVTSVSFKLRSLILDGCSNATGAIFETLPDTLWRLSFDGNRKITDAPLGKFLARCPGLRELSLKSTNITGECFKVVLSEKVETLNLAKIEVSYGEFSDAGIESLCKVASKSLVTLAVQACAKVTDSCAGAIATCTKLEELIIKECEAVTDAFPAAVAKGCKKLKNIWFCEGPQLTDKGVAALAAEIKGVDTFVIGPCKITNAAFTSVATWAPTLVEFVALESSTINDDGITALSACKKLQRIRLDSISSITEGGVQKLIAALPDLTDFHCLECGIKPTLIAWGKKNKPGVSIQLDEGVDEGDEEEGD